MEAKPGMKTSEILALVAGLLTVLVPVLLEKIPPDSIWAVILGAVGAVAVYIGGRSWVKAAASKATAIAALSDKPGDPR